MATCATPCRRHGGDRDRCTLALGSFNVSVAPSGASLGLQISNAGNALIGTTRGAATVSQGSTVLFRQPIELAAFVPQTTITYAVESFVLAPNTTHLPPRKD